MKHHTREDIQGQTVFARALGCVGGNVGIHLGEDETAWNPDGDAFTGPAELTYKFTFQRDAACDMCLKCSQCATCVMG